MNDRIQFQATRRFLMKQPNNRLAGLVVVSALALGAAAAVFAASGDPGMMGGPGMGMVGTPADTAKRLDEVKGELAISPAQNGAWNAYEQAVVNQSSLMNAHHQTMGNNAVTPSSDQRTAMPQQGAATMQQSLKATQDLYKVLTPEQQAKADRLLPFHRGGGMYQ
jgi:Spy/CpxP family protein refolding chaperone